MCLLRLVHKKWCHFCLFFSPWYPSHHTVGKHRPHENNHKPLKLSLSWFPANIQYLLLSHVSETSWKCIYRWMPAFFLLLELLESLIWSTLVSWTISENKIAGYKWPWAQPLFCMIPRTFLPIFSFSHQTSYTSLISNVNLVLWASTLFLFLCCPLGATSHIALFIFQAPTSPTPSPPKKPQQSNWHLVHSRNYSKHFTYNYSLSFDNPVR